MKAYAALFLLPGVIVGTALLTLDDMNAQAAPAADAAASPVLVELFTSQGCSSCPPADALAEKLAKEEGLVVVSRPVTYWDRLGWKDTLAREDNSRLQRAYAQRGIAGKNGVYTPQIVIDGKRGTVGSNEALVRQYIGHERKAPAAISARTLEDGSLAVGVAGAGTDAELVLLAMRSHVTVRIGAGENGNRAIGYTKVVVDEQVVAEWAGGKQGVHVKADRLKAPRADRYALVLREKDAGPVLASRLIG